MLRKKREGINPEKREGVNPEKNLRGLTMISIGEMGDFAFMDVCVPIIAFRFGFFLSSIRLSCFAFLPCSFLTWTNTYIALIQKKAIQIKVQKQLRFPNVPYHLIQARASHKKS